jgi:hypothetical protein
MEKPLQHHGGRLEHNETYCGSCYGAQEVCFSKFQDKSLTIYIIALHPYRLLVLQSNFGLQ